MGQRTWKLMEDWLQAVASESEAFEIQALIAPIQEKRWSALIGRYGALGIVSPKPDRGPGPGGSKWCLVSGCSHDQISQVAMENWKRSGRVADAERFYQQMWSYEEGDAPHGSSTCPRTAGAWAAPDPGGRRPRPPRVPVRPADSARVPRRPAHAVRHADRRSLL